MMATSPRAEPQIGEKRSRDDSAPAVKYARHCEEDIAQTDFMQGWYFEGRGRFEEAHEYYTKAARNAHVEALFRLGFMYENGPAGIEQSYDKAINCYEEASALGNMEASYYLGCLHESGITGVDNKVQKAVFCFLQAASFGSSLAKEKLQDYALHKQKA